MKKIAIFGNSGSGKSTLAQKLCANNNLAHLDLDSIAWQQSEIPERKPIAESEVEINKFINAHQGWVIEGCYSDLLEIALKHTTEIIFLNLPIEACISNAKRRPWEPHKYPSKEAQDNNLNMLIDWIKEYENRTDTFSKSAHESLFNSFDGIKFIYTSNN
ncbi:shikimate kinase [Parashewanella curva]|uniref:Shikimate kinase n=1 Tax=Parashewanella curva TaxID=2338552 RepID=A0A3L8PWI6_9GAMM|nr:AAA family ATPase [Parashewanella curva]RLV58983.1 shikimate kinase [Parashewanella curva]